MPDNHKTYTIIGACFEVYNRMGCGFLESVYHGCLEIELTHRSIPYESQKALGLTYRDQALPLTYIPDFICYGDILLEIKATSHLADEHTAQLLNYLHAGGFDTGLLANFGHYPKLEYKRFVL